MHDGARSTAETTRLTLLVGDLIIRHVTNLRNTITGVYAAVRIGKAIDHPLRVRALEALRHRELCVCELIHLFGLAPSTVSKHMSILSDAGLVDRRRQGRWTYYSLPAEPDEPLVHALRLVHSLASGDPLVVRDGEGIPALSCGEVQ